MGDIVQHLRGQLDIKALPSMVSEAPLSVAYEHTTGA
jgi:hypothetical protein